MADELDIAAAHAAKRAPLARIEEQITAHGTCDYPDDAVLVLVAEVRRLRDENERLSQYGDVDTQTAADMATRAFNAEAERDALRATIKRVQALTAKWVEQVDGARSGAYGPGMGDTANVLNVVVLALRAALDGEHT